MAHAPMDLESGGRGDALQFKAHALAWRARGGLDSLRAALEADDLARALDLRQDLLTGLDALAVLTGEQFPLESPGARRTDLEALQAFRRAAERDLERLDAARAALCRSSWRSPADAAREAAARSLAARVLAGALLLSALLASWWGWQRHELAASRAAVDAARTATAREGVRLVSLGAWLAVKNTGKPLAELAADMTGECAALDLRKAPPSHPCSQAWARNRMALFRGAIPAPGAPMDPPAEIFFDPWGAPYALVIPKAGPARIVSAGPDGLLDTPDDVAALIPYWDEPGR